MFMTRHMQFPISIEQRPTTSSHLSPTSQGPCVISGRKLKWWDEEEPENSEGSKSTLKCHMVIHGERRNHSILWAYLSPIQHKNLTPYTYAAKISQWLGVDVFFSGIWLGVGLRMNTKMTCVWKTLEYVLKIC